MKQRFKNERSCIFEQSLVSSVVIILMVLLTVLGLNNNEKSAKQVALIEREERMIFNVENTILQIENFRKTLLDRYTMDANYAQADFEDLLTKEEIIAKWDKLQSSNELLLYCDISVVNSKNLNKEYESKALELKSYYNGNEPPCEKVIKTKNHTITLTLSPNYIYNKTLDFTRNSMHNAIYSKNEYIWVNQVLDYDGGDDYAIRLIHPNLIDTENQLLSTSMTDSVGAFPYKTEL